MSNREQPKTGKSKIARILDDEMKLRNDTQGTVNGTLAGLFRDFLYGDGVSKQKWMQLMNDFMQDHRNNAPNNKTEQTTFRGNITKELGREQFTFKNFCRGMRFLGFRGFKITITAIRDEGEHCIQERIVDFGPKNRIHDFMAATEEDTPVNPDTDDNNPL